MEIQRIEIKKYLKILIRRKFVFMGVALMVMSGIVWGSYFMSKKYEAKSMVFIESNVIKNLVGGIAITPSMNDRIRVLRYAMLSRGLISKVVKDLDLDTKVKNDAKVEEMITDFQARTTINVRGNDMFIVSFTDTNPKLAMDYINSLVRNYVEENISAKREESYGANSFLKEQVALLKDKVNKGDDEIIKFRQRQGVYVSIDENALINDIKSYKTEIDSIDVKKNELLATKNSIKKQLEGKEPLNSSGGAIVAALENRIKQLLVVYTENYPEIVKLRAEIDAAKKQQVAAPKNVEEEAGVMSDEDAATNPIYSDLRQRYLQAESDISALDAKRKKLLSLISARENELRVLPADKKKLYELEQERNANRELFEQLRQRLGQSEFSKKMEIEDKSTTFRIVDPAVLPTRPVTPRLKVMLAGVFIGLIGGIGAVFLREQFDSSIKETQTLKLLGLEVLAVIPKIFNETENRKKVKKERLIYTLAGIYFLVICSSLALEVMIPSYVDGMIMALNLDSLKDNMVHAAKGIF
ncbi:MAG: chain length-determining protein [Deltaproteobacteria bacterium]|nr:chain length-determining protein [Deltaproteobacteria bacterium]